MTTNLTQGIPPQPYGKTGRKVYLPVSATAQFWQGAMLALLNGALVTGTTAGAGPCVGVAEADTLGGASNGTIRGVVLTDMIFRIAPGTLAPTDATPYGTVLFMETDNTVGTGAPGQQIAGRFMGIEDDGWVRVYISNQASWFDSNVNANDGGNAAFKARVVMTSLGANTGTTTGTLTITATGALAAQDGVTLAAGDRVFIQEGTTNLAAASDAGLWLVANAGAVGVSAVFSRPPEWETGATITPGQDVQVGGEGAIWGGTEWKTFAAKGAVVDTNAPLFWVREMTQAITLVAGTATISNVGVRSASKTQVVPTRTATGGTVATTVEYCPTVAGASGITAGAVGTGSVVVQATVAAGTIQNADTSTLAVTVLNW